MTSLLLPKVPKVYHTSNKDDWATPQQFFAVLHQEFQFDLDVCANPGNTTCPLFFSEDDNALGMDWFGCAFMNPPYSKVGVFMDEMMLQLDEGHITRGVALVAARPDTEWFQQATMYASEIRFLKGRLKFEVVYPLSAYEEIADLVVNGWVRVSPLEADPARFVKDPAPFPSAVFVFDKSRPERQTIWWDWKHGTVTAYAYDIVKNPDLPSQSLPPEVQDALDKVHKIEQQILDAYKKGELVTATIETVPKGTPLNQFAPTALYPSVFTMGQAALAQKMGLLKELEQLEQEKAIVKAKAEATAFYNQIQKDPKINQKKLLKALKTGKLGLTDLKNLLDKGALIEPAQIPNFQPTLEQQAYFKGQPLTYVPPPTLVKTLPSIFDPADPNPPTWDEEDD